MSIFQVIQIITAILLIVVILLQQRGAGLSGIFGGSNDVFRTKRGLEKILFIATIIIAIIFFLISLAGVII
ncbi:preprotein translocase subunit SecG [Candidatus Falkowbacteria bacterium CG_4_10_14_0_2_um_filter_48_10]|uniref:Protein-export membrane protein SecG n=1 Tax=Candidatus Falkowbacteria bacterium CG23_combo_of_CG06-09_8_20_14_all_49_15 TaxID=1974572 RepID=A0A2G9ZKA0_9BACT|nr:MAG: preprotein translocase subunit SecG [Candidatus Falkowbacteria bacterium CG23_combo_of_CG06-09_8_20_14_all_49_15]PJA07776.1 MAG: preprotein translocase subunit SecG [Candidatus Falkowbacteria bacterium CG_4_10_14_0_2_um_filter_48_10]